MTAHFRPDNTFGYTLNDLPLLNAAVERLLDEGAFDRNDPSSVTDACYAVNDAWSTDGRNTVETLSRLA